MALDFTAAGQRVNFGTISALANLENKTVTAWVYPDTIGDFGAGDTDSIIEKISYSSPFPGWYLDYYQSGGDNSIRFSQTYSGTVGVWLASGDITTGAWQQIAVTYASGNVDNDPIFYRNGAAVGIDSETTPAGTVISDSSVPLNIGGGYQFSVVSMDGKLQDVRIYNRILSADEIYSLYTSRRINFLRYGLVFHAPLIGASGLTKFDGTTLGATNYLKDIAGGVQGAVVGSPVGAGNTIQRVY